MAKICSFWVPLQPKKNTSKCLPAPAGEKNCIFCNLVKLKLPLLINPNGNFKWQKNCSFWVPLQPKLNLSKCLPATAGKKNSFCNLVKLKLTLLLIPYGNLKWQNLVFFQLLLQRKLSLCHNVFFPFNCVKPRWAVLPTWQLKVAKRAHFGCC